MLLVHVFSGWPFKGIRHQPVGFDFWENSKTRRNSKRPHSLALEMRNPFGHRQENLMANYASYTEDNHPSRLQSCLPLTCSLKQIDIIWSRTHLSVYLQWETIGPKVFQPLSMNTKGSDHGSVNYIIFSTSEGDSNRILPLLPLPVSVRPVSQTWQMMVYSSFAVEQEVGMSAFCGHSVYSVYQPKSDS